ncbi:MAG TPA: peptide deformylase [Candidatus Latescibacteria bacterium]|nr:peptide deformylase [Candidatus Latescibacterota bacterium]
MSPLEIRRYPDPILRQISTSVEAKEIDTSLQNLIDNMAYTMYIFKGLGLAAPQVGVLSRIITVDTGEGLIALVNPRILKGEGEEIGEEGCLSIPDIWLEIKRARKVIVDGMDRTGQKVLLEAEGLLARAFQHEIDHLNGVLIIDRVSHLQRQLIESKLRRLRKEQGTLRPSSSNRKSFT